MRHPIRGVIKEFALNSAMSIESVVTFNTNNAHIVPNVYLKIKQLPGFVLGSL